VTRARIAVAPASAAAGLERLLGALAGAFPADFVAWSEGADHDGVLVLHSGPSLPALDDLTGLGAPVLALAGAADPGAAPQDVLLAEHPAVDRRLRGLTLAGQQPSAALAPSGAEEVLASGPGGGALWVRAGRVERVAAAPEELGEAEGLRDALHSEHALAAVAIVQFVRALTREADLTPPPLRAALLFDDPNLRRPTYGFIRYPELLRHADEHGYHASMAMIPLDAGRAHPDAVALFRERPDRLSLVFHGNNHESRELLAPADLPRGLAVCAQALRRMARFEAATGLGVDRVMTSPHGLCSRHTARALGALSYDGLCAVHPFPWMERPPAERPLAGWEPATFVEGCAVLPRIPLDSPPTAIALRAFLDQPLILYGHHDDVAGGLDPLAEARVNALGDVRWMSLGQIAQSNYALRVDGATAVVRPYAGRLATTLAPEVTEVTVIAPEAGAGAFSGWSVPGPRAARAAIGEPLAAGGGAGLELRLHTRWETDAATVPMPGRRPWPTLRRAGTEIRDRLAPLRR
jgi:hypothetical protein